MLAFVVSVCMYLADRKGWNATAKRLSNIARAHIESAKPIKEIEKQTEKRALDTWTAEFEGKPLETGPNHVIIKTWFSRVGGSVSPYFKCKCGHTDWHVDIEAATRLSKRHVSEQNNADEMLKRNGGTHAW